MFDMGMKVAAVSLLCQDPRVFSAMETAGTPCPVDGKIGKDALDVWNATPELRPDYKEYKEKQRVIHAKEKQQIVIKNKTMKTGVNR